MADLPNTKGNDKNVPYTHFEWIRELSPHEISMEDCQQKGPLLIWYQLELSSSKPLHEDHVKRAVVHLYRKVPNLGLSIGNRSGEIWFRKATNPDVDFKVLHRVRLEEITKQMLNYHYNRDTGPLFCARLIYDSPGVPNDPYNIEPTFPHKCHIIFGLTHAITDGISNMCIMGFFISLLNDVIAGKPINDQEPLGAHASGEEITKLIEKKKSVLENDPDLRKQIAHDIEFPTHNIPLINKFRLEPETEPQSGYIVNTLNQEMTSAFLNRCSREKITVNSVVTALFNLAFVKVAIDQGIDFESVVIHNYHTINLRRYWQDKAEKILGLHMGYAIMMHTKTSRDSHDHFWEYARNLGENLKQYILSERILADKAYVKFFSVNDPNSDTNHSVCDFLTSNLGNVTNMVTEGGKYVKITNVGRGTSCHEILSPVMVNFHTFRGIFTISFEYNMVVLPRNIAEKIFSKAMQSIREIVQ